MLQPETGEPLRRIDLDDKMIGDANRLDGPPRADPHVIDALGGIGGDGERGVELDRGDTALGRARRNHHLAVARLDRCGESRRSA